MRVLHMDAGREIRGGQRQVLLLMESLREAGHEQRLLANPAGLLWQAAAQLKVKVAPLWLFTIPRHSSWAEMVHAHDARSHTLAACASRRPFVVSRRVAFPVRRGPLSRWKYRRARRYLAVSKFVAAELVHAGVPATKVDVVFDGIDTEQQLRTQEPSTEDFRAIALASRDSQKGRDLVERAAKLAKLPVEYSEWLSKDLPGASAFLYVTRFEGLGSAALLAMSHGVPVIASRVGGLPEAVRHEQEGLLVENNPTAIAQAMQRLCADRALAHRLGQNGRQRVEQMFTKRQLVERTLAAYQRALNASA